MAGEPDSGRAFIVHYIFNFRQRAGSVDAVKQKQNNKER